LQFHRTCSFYSDSLQLSIDDDQIPCRCASVPWSTELTLSASIFLQSHFATVCPELSVSDVLQTKGADALGWMAMYVYSEHSALPTRLIALYGQGFWEHDGRVPNCRHVVKRRWDRDLVATEGI
jgi:hypothetical protein